MNGVVIEKINAAVEAMKAQPSCGRTSFEAELEWKDSTRNEIRIGQFPSITIDEPVEMGGTGKGPNPGELLLGALAGCFSVTFEMFASSLGIKIHGLKTSIKGFVELSNVFGITEGTHAMHDIEITLKVVADADFERVKQIAMDAASTSAMLASMKFAPKVTVVALRG